MVIGNNSSLITINYIKDRFTKEYLNLKQSSLVTLINQIKDRFVKEYLNLKESSLLFTNVTDGSFC